MIDAHIHLDQYRVNSIKEKIRLWQDQGIESVVAIATSLESSYEILKLKQEYPCFVRAAIGHHPEAKPPSNNELYELMDLIKLEKQRLSGIGEIGLPTYKKKELYNHFHKEHFLYVLEAFLQIAKREDLPVALHAVHEESRVVLASLKKLGINKAHFHWLKAPKDVVYEIVNGGYHISVTPEVCYRERDQLLVRQVPIHQLLIETDGPWKHNGPFKERETSPLFLKEIIESLANILFVPRKSLIQKISQNTKQLYQI